MKHLVNLRCRVSAIMLVLMVGVLSVVPCNVPGHATSFPAPTNLTFPRTLTLHDGKLTAQLNAVPLEQVMAEVSRLSGALVLWLGKVKQQAPVSVEFHDLPVPEALQRLLGENNFLLFYTATKEDVRLTQIWISAQGQGTQQILLAPLPSADRAALSPPPADAAYAGEETVDSIIETALHHPDAMIRLLTVSKLGMRVQEDVRAKAIVAQMALNDSDPSVRSVAADMLDSLEDQEQEE